ncbi:DUF4112 domain-containing protein [Marinicauda sp. Alg238-R41]|uniref:DUF4112 domain-containing protein n=1 Tax=Marinicauda sp. Alg238-R41 TaxID=2993447 RepID=UPI0022E23FC5|nr:DUF4112 domain-containing protein [Marinicauda sp. Alg238-R41]
MARPDPGPPTRQHNTPAELHRARQWAYLLDSRFKIANFRFGLDGILGLVPVAGDAVTLIGGAFMLFTAHRLGLSNWTKLKITFYTAADAVFGSIPLIGDLFDFAFKSHLNSLNAIEKEIERRKR